jgi:hypothetical protein
MRGYLPDRMLLEDPGDYQVPKLQPSVPIMKYRLAETNR